MLNFCLTKFKLFDIMSLSKAKEKTHMKKNEIRNKVDTIKGLETALRHANWGIRYMTLEHNERGDYIRVDFKDVYRPSYHINITGSSPQGIILDVMAFIQDKKYK